MARCPVCRKRKTMLKQKNYGDPAVPVPEPFYQVSVPGKHEYVSPRCSGCLVRLLEKRAEKTKKD